MEVNANLNKPNKIYAFGYANVTEKINYPVEFSYELNRCDLKNSKCEKFETMKVSYSQKMLRKS